MDITYIPMARGFVYLAVVLDWFSRRVLSWRVSITMEAAFCVETLEDALARHGKPDIFNTDQGSQFTGSAFTGVLADNGIAISMDGKGAWRDNVFVERTLMKRMGIEALYRRPRTTKPEPGHKIYPYLLRGMEIVAAATRCGRWTSLTSRWRVASSIWLSCSTGSAVAYCRGGCRSRWKRHSASRRWRMPWLVTASRTSSTRTRARSSRARPSPACSPTAALRSAWTAKGLGGTTCSSSACGAASSTRRSICEPTTASARPALRSAATWASTTVHQNTHLAM